MRLPRAIWVGLALLAASCGGRDEGPPIFTLQVNSQDVVLNAVDGVEIVIEPRPLDRNFERVPEMTHLGGQVTTRVSARGEYVILIGREWVQDHAQMPPMQAFVLDVPLEADPEPDRAVLDDPVVRVTFVRREERIAAGAGRLLWPLPEGGETIVSVRCIRDPMMDFSRQCTNNDGIDAGPTVDPDAGPTVDPDAGAPADGG